MVLFEDGDFIKVDLQKQHNQITIKNYFNILSVNKYIVCHGMELIKFYIVDRKMEIFICGA
jgi:hypothetical protein